MFRESKLRGIEAARLGRDVSEKLDIETVAIRASKSVPPQAMKSPRGSRESRGGLEDSVLQ